MQSNHKSPNHSVSQTRADKRPFFSGHRPAAALGLGLIALAQPCWAAQPPAEVYLLGDSGSEMGNLFAIPEFAPGPNAPYWRGPDGFLRHSSGPKWAELLFPGMRVSSDPAHTGERVNYAYDGAMTNEWVGGFPTTYPGGLLSQTSLFEADVAAGRLHPRSDSAFVIDIGPNDYFDSFNEGTDPYAVFESSANNIATSIRRLAAVARTQPGTTDRPLTFFVSDLPNFAEAPLFLNLYKTLPDDVAAGNRQLLTDLVAQGWAQTRETLLATRQELGSGVNIVTLPCDTLFTEMRKNPTAFGLTNITDQVYDDTTDTVLVTGAAAENYLFVDGLHLTAKGERILANYYTQVVETTYGRPQQRLARLTDTGLAATEDFARTLTQAPRITGDARWSGFVDASGGYRRATLPGDEGRWEYFPSSLVAGIENAPAAGWSWGAGATLMTAPTWVENKALRTDFQGGAVGLFGRHDLGWATLTGTASWMRLSGEVTRTPTAVPMKATGRTHETIWQTEIALARSFALRSWTLDLELGTRFARADVAGYSEKGAPGLNLRFDDFNRDSVRTQLAARVRPADWTWGSVRVQPSLSLTSAFEEGDGRTAVRAWLIDNTADPTFGYADNGRHFLFGATPEVAFVFPHEIRLVLRGFVRSDFSGWRETGGTCALGWRF